MNSQQFIKDLIDEGYTKEEAAQITRDEIKKRRAKLPAVDKFIRPESNRINNELEHSGDEVINTYK